MGKPDHGHTDPIRIEVHHFLHNEEMSGNVPQLLTQILERLGVIEAQGVELMAVSQATQAVIDAINAKLDSVATALTSAASGLSADIQALKDALNQANNGMSEADVNAALQPISDRADAIAAAAQALTDLDAANP